MPSALVSAEVVVGVLVALAVLALLSVFVRRRVIAGGNDLALCGHRRAGSTHWRLGLLRLGTTRLEWFPLLGLTMRSRHEWQRHGVHCYYGDLEFDLGLQTPHYTALRSWLEAAPPGSHANVA